MLTITLTDKARAMFHDFLAGEEDADDLAIRLAVAGRGPRGFSYALDFMKESERTAEDIELDFDDFKMFVDPESAEDLDGTEIDFAQRGLESGFKFNNPNALWKDPNAQAVQDVLDGEINPGVASHGGYVTLLDVKGDTAYISLGGGCQGCGMADVTLKQGIEVAIKEAVPAIENVYDTTDHAAGTNPYYSGSPDGESPFV